MRAGASGPPLGLGDGGRLSGLSSVWGCVTPASGSSNVGVGESIIVQFSEPMNEMSVLTAFSFAVAGNPWAVAATGDYNVFVFKPVQPLPLGTTCDARVSTAAP